MPVSIYIVCSLAVKNLLKGLSKVFISFSTVYIFNIFISFWYYSNLNFCHKFRRQPSSLYNNISINTLSLSFSCPSPSNAYILNILSCSLSECFVNHLIYMNNSTSRDANIHYILVNESPFKFI